MTWEYVWSDEGYRAPQAARPVEETTPIVIAKDAHRAYVCPKESQARSRVLEEAAHKVLLDCEKPTSCADLADLTGRSQTAVAKALAILVKEGRAHRTRGAGTKTQPYLYTAVKP